MVIFIRYREFITFFGTTELNKIYQFYCEIMGLTIYKDQKICHIYNITNESKIGFCTHMPVFFDEKAPIITFIVDNVDELYEDPLKVGVEITKPPIMNPKFVIYHFFLRDPNSYTIEIQKFLD